MIQDLKRIKYYALCLLTGVGLFSYGSFTGTRFLGDDNKNKDGHTINTSGSGHMGGHGYYFHK